MNIVLPNKLSSFIWYFIKPYKIAGLLYLVFAIIPGSWAPLNAYFTKIIIDSLGKSQLTNVFSTIFWPSAFIVINFVVHELCWRGSSYLNYKYQPVIKNRIIQETFDYIHHHASQFFQNNFAGRIASQINILADNIEVLVHEIFRQLVRGVVLLIIAFVSMFLVNHKFFYVLLAWFIVFGSVSIFFCRRLIDLSEQHADTESTLAGQLVDSITNASNVRIFARRDYEISYLQNALNATKKAFQYKEMFTLKINFFQFLSMACMFAGMLYFLIQLRMQQLVSIGGFALILGLSFESAWITWWSIDQLYNFNKAVGKCKQSIASLFIPIEIKDHENAKPLIVDKGQILFSNVRFQYKDAEPLFENKSVIIESGQKVGLVGYSGSGKTTFVNLILRLYDINDGNILIDNQDISEVTQDSLHSNIAMIPQDPSLFHRTLLENIRYGKVDATDDEVVEAAKQAHAHEFIVELTQGYNSLVGERGIKLSGGQRQRIAIARSILKNAPILILDEATSQLDSLTESKIQESLWKLMQNRTTIIIAHRLSTLLCMDRILVFDRGSIVQDGKHADLLHQQGLYKTLWDAQVGGFLPDNNDDQS